MHLAARSEDLALIEFEVEVEVVKGVVFDRTAGFAQRLELRQPFDGEASAQRKPRSGETQSPLQIVVC